MSFDYKKLKLKIKEVYDTQKNFAGAMQMDTAVLNQRLNNKVAWKTCEIYVACKLLNIDMEDIPLYFFNKKV